MNKMFTDYTPQEAVVYLQDKLENDPVFSDLVKFESFTKGNLIMFLENAMPLLSCLPDSNSLYGLSNFINDFRGRDTLQKWLLAATETGLEGERCATFFVTFLEVHFCKLNPRMQDLICSQLTRLVDRIIMSLNTEAVYQVMTATEAAELWGVGEATVKQACSGQKGFPPRFAPEEFRKSKGTWLVTRAGMERLYGSLPSVD